MRLDVGEQLAAQFIPAEAARPTGAREAASCAAATRHPAKAREATSARARAGGAFTAGAGESPCGAGYTPRRRSGDGAPRTEEQ